jgi:ATP-dependent Lon protease
MKIQGNSLIRLTKNELPMVPLRDIVVFPHMIIPFFIGRKRSVKAVEQAMNKGKIIFLASQKVNKVEISNKDELCEYGTIAKILQMLKLPDGTIRVLVEGHVRASVVKLVEKKTYFNAKIKPVKTDDNATANNSALIRSVKNEFERYSSLLKKIPLEITSLIKKIDAPDRLIDTICANTPIKYDKKMEILSIVNSIKRLETMLSVLMEEIELLELEMKISTKVKKRIEKTQKNYYLNEQLKEIQKQLGRNEGDDPGGANELELRLKDKGLDEYAYNKCLKEVKRLKMLQPMSPEAGILRTYLEWICDLPWKEYSKDIKDIDKAKTILDSDHYGLKKVKERILDFIAVRQLKEKVKGPILCFVGPPGTGKTSLGKSVARCLGRDFVRISLGGVRDEAEIRGHRKTYIGALPGKIIQSMRKANCKNPVFLLDEVDKMNSDFRGDPAAALLEVLDPEQNKSFMDHYLEVPYDLSNVMFITTANSVHNIPYPLRDRMEIIDISGYTDYEKEKIADKFLIPKQKIENGLDWADITFSKNTILKIIHNYTMESGVRSLEREIGNVLRKIARVAVKKGLHLDENENHEDEPKSTENIKKTKEFTVKITSKSLEKYLGNIKYMENSLDKELKPGLSFGLAWTELGGTMLTVEVALLKGKGELFLTGNLGDVMKESAQASISFLRANAEKLGIPGNFHEENDIHIHVPEGAIPKDGPSAGITITAALLSSLKGICIKKDLAMTGEITLTGRLLPIGGVREKVLAAYRNKMTHVLLPEMNRKDSSELPKEVKDKITFIFAESVIDALYEIFPGEAKNK